MSFHTCIKQWGNNLLYVGYDDLGKRVQKKIAYVPKLWTNCQSETGYTDIYGNPLQELNFENIKEAKEFIKQYEDVENFNVYGTNRFDQLFIAETYKADIDYDLTQIRTFYLDIENMADKEGNFVEPQDASAPITLITIYDTKTNKFIVFSNISQTNTQYICPTSSDIDYRECNTEYEMLLNFLVYWEGNYPDIVTGWNTRGYDIVYIINRMNKILGEKQTNRLSPWGIISEKRSNVKRFGRTEERPSYEIYGINELDYMDLYMKYNMGNSESFALNFIAEKELGEAKISYNGSLDDLYKNDFQKYVEYNIHDVRLVLKLEQKKQFISLIADMSYFGKVSMFNDTLGTVRFWEYLIFNHLYKQRKLPKIVALDTGSEDNYEGGYVKEPKPGLYSWVASVDATSLYPSLIRQMNIGLDTHIEYPSINDPRLSHYRTYNKEDYLDLSDFDNSVLLEKNYGLACNNELYSNDKQSFLSELMELLFNNRKKYKKMMLDCKKEAAKIDEEILKREKV